MEQAKNVVAVQHQNGKMTLINRGMFGLGLALAAGLSHAETAAGVPDVTTVVSSLTGLLAPIAAVGGAMLTVAIALKGYKLIRRAL